jgi:hypothetical protein
MIPRRFYLSILRGAAPFSAVLTPPNTSLGVPAGQGRGEWVAGSALVASNLRFASAL